MADERKRLRDENWDAICRVCGKMLAISKLAPVKYALDRRLPLTTDQCNRILAIVAEDEGKGPRTD